MRIYLANLFADMSNEKISKTELLTTRQNNNKLWHNYKKRVTTASKYHSVLTKMNKILKPTGVCTDVWSLYQNISEPSFTNPDLSALKYD